MDGLLILFFILVIFDILLRGDGKLVGMGFVFWVILFFCFGCYLGVLC
jgi:hypothetical protein